MKLELGNQKYRGRKFKNQKKEFSIKQELVNFFLILVMKRKVLI